MNISSGATTTATAFTDTNLEISIHCQIIQLHNSCFSGKSSSAVSSLRQNFAGALIFYGTLCSQATVNVAIVASYAIFSACRLPTIYASPTAAATASAAGSPVSAPPDFYRCRATAFAAFAAFANAKVQSLHAERAAAAAAAAGRT